MFTRSKRTTRSSSKSIGESLEEGSIKSDSIQLINPERKRKQPSNQDVAKNSPEKQRINGINELFKELHEDEPTLENFEILNQNIASEKQQLPQENEWKRVTSNDLMIPELLSFKRLLKKVIQEKIMKGNEDETPEFQSIMDESNIPGPKVYKCTQRGKLMREILRISIENMTDASFQYEPTSWDIIYECRVEDCFYRETNFELLNRHTSFHYGEDILKKYEITELKCNYCGFDALSKEYLIMHLAFDHSALTSVLEDKGISIQKSIKKTGNPFKIISREEEDVVKKMDVDIFRGLMNNPPYGSSFQELICPVDGCPVKCGSIGGFKQHIVSVHMKEKLDEKFPWIINEKGCFFCKNIKIPKKHMRYDHVITYHNILEVLMGGTILMRSIFIIQSAIPIKHSMKRGIIANSEQGTWKYSCPIKDCFKTNIVHNRTDFLRHLSIYHFYEILEELFENDVKESKCKICQLGIPYKKQILVHQVVFHEGLGKVLGNEEMLNLLNSSVISRGIKNEQK